MVVLPGKRPQAPRGKVRSMVVKWGGFGAALLWSETAPPDRSGCDCLAHDKRPRSKPMKTQEIPTHRPWSRLLVAGLLGLSLTGVVAARPPMSHAATGVCAED